LKETLVDVRELKVWFQATKGLVSILLPNRGAYIHAVDGVTFEIQKREIFCLAGESGCGKTTTAKAALGLVPITSGEVQFDGTALSSLDNNKLRHLRREMQMVYQDPYESLNPRMRIRDIVAEPLRIHHLTRDKHDEAEKINSALVSVGLTPPEAFADRFPHELSGGQRQRVAIASAIVINPKFIVADEPVSMLDVSVRSGILNLMFRLRDELNLTYLFITHDLALARNISDRIAIMYLGKIVEVGPKDAVTDLPTHPYTQALLTAVPEPNPKTRRSAIPISGETPKATNIPSGCRFRTRCPKAFDKCHQEEPRMVQVGIGHYSACHLNHDVT
jgi:oligopeptide/dipeptide ABC transporter ATP-binding protein